MEFDVPFNITKEELIGALKTIYLFLNGINFTYTGSALKEECMSKGYELEVVDKEIIIQSRNLDQSVQTDGQDDEDRTCQLQSSIHSEPESKEGVLLYYKEPFTSYTLSSKEIIINVEKVSQKSSMSDSEKEKILHASKINCMKESSNGGFCKSKSDPVLNLSTGFSVADSKEHCLKEEIDCKSLRKKMRTLENDYKKLMGVATELTAALQTHIMGQSENLNTMLNNCKVIYPELFKKPEDVEVQVTLCDISEHKAFEPFVEPVDNNNITLIQDVVQDPLVEETDVDVDDRKLKPDLPTTLVESPKPIVQVEVKEPEKKHAVFLCQSRICAPISEVPCNFSLSEEHFQLDYKKLKADLANDNSELQLALVAALQQIIMCNAKDVRNAIMNSYMENDLLNILPDKKNIAATLFRPDSACAAQLQEETARLLNTIASLKLGREYFCKSEDFLPSFLIPVIKGTYEPKVVLTSTTEEMLIATVQKLSLKYRQRESMISAELTEYLVKFLTEKCLSLSAYCLEYATALFMNLCLHQSARERLRPLAKEVFESLANLLNAKYECCMPYVNGAIYSLLSDEYMNKEAHRQNFFELIQYHIQETEGEIRSELEHIIRVHLENTEKDTCSCDSTIEPEFEVDILEPELNSTTANCVNSKEIIDKYKDASVKLPSNKCLRRPTTPAKHMKDKNLKKKEIIRTNMSYCEETMQFYYTPTKTHIFEPQTKIKHKPEPGTFVKTPRKKTSICNPNCTCHHSLGKTTPYASDNSISHNIIYNVPACYRNNYEYFKTQSNSNNCTDNRYSCNCYQMLSKDIDFSSTDKEKNVTNRIHYCPKCQKNHQLDDANLEVCNNRKNSGNHFNGGVVNFSLNEITRTIGSQQKYSLIDEDGPGYSTVFQSRPKILRTPP